jgi:hypothetical protein
LIGGIVVLTNQRLYQGPFENDIRGVDPQEGPEVPSR